MKEKSVLFVESTLHNLNRKRRSASKSYSKKVLLGKYLPIFFILVSFKSFFPALIVSVLYWLFFTILFDHRAIWHFDPVISVWFGVPGSGKTSVAAWLTKASLKSHFKVLSNVNIAGAYKLDEEDLGYYDMSFDGEGCHVIYDEASLEGLDNRLHKDFAKSNKPKYFALHRHMDNRVDVFSQAYDIDKRVRDRAGASRLFLLKRFPIPGFIFYRRIKKVLFIKKDDKQMIDGFDFFGLPRICYTRSVWHSFDTKDLSLCPTEQKKWELWSSDEDLSDEDLSDEEVDL